MTFRRPAAGNEKVEQNTTPMIDIVFQLLAFFVMTFKIASVEGNFDLKLPKPANGYIYHGHDIKVRLIATQNGGCQIVVDNRPIDSFAALRALFRQLADPHHDWSSGLELTLDPDYQLRFEHLIHAITAVSGYVEATENGPVVVPLISKTRIADPRPRHEN